MTYPLADSGTSTASRPPWCPCCAYAQSCDGCSTARRAAGRGVVTRCLCAGRGPGEGHAPGCEDADQPWGPPYLLPVYTERTEYRRVEDPSAVRGYRWERTVRRIQTSWRRCESDEEALAYLGQGPGPAAPPAVEGAATAEASPVEASTAAPEHTLALLDAETTGLPRRGHVPRVVELAVAIVSYPSGRVVELRSSLVDPQAPIPADATRVHGISDRDVRGKPTWRAVWPKVLALLNRHAPVALVAHNATFDRAVVEGECERAGLATPTAPWVCSMALARTHLPGRSSYALGQLAEGLGVAAGAAHRAKGDVETLSRVLPWVLRGRPWSEVVGALPSPSRRRGPSGAKGRHSAQAAFLDAAGEGA